MMPRGVAEPIVISGLGTLGRVGVGLEVLETALATGLPVEPHDFEAAPPDLSPWLSPRAARRMSPPSKLGVTATRMALEDAGLGAEALPGPVAVVAATSFGPSSFTEGLLEQIFGDQPQAASPFYFTESVANAAAAQVALALKAVGPNITVTQRVAGPLIALNRAAGEIARGRASSAVVLAVDEMTALLLDALQGFGAHAAARARPFDRHRDGFVATEGATALILEPAASVQRRGARGRARWLGGFQGFDPGSTPSNWSDDPTVLTTAVERGLSRLGTDPTAIDRWVASASGSHAGDRLEAAVLHRAFGEALPTVLAPKAVTGEYAGGHLAASVLAVSDLAWGSTPGFDEADPELVVLPHDGRPLASPKRVLTSALSAGGSAAWTLLGADSVVTPA